ncbi:L-Aminoadipate-Semialdehyde Dehydrogenase-Phosphopantetheinyl Transferase [Manis pentadactyla]|nr:L-Aminoadipate-Semialdehyde Dehydrogenase-Phosphopantetheinyl Transferase [Manis pentadactyla]
MLDHRVGQVTSFNLDPFQRTVSFSRKMSIPLTYEVLRRKIKAHPWSELCAFDFQWGHDAHRVTVPLGRVKAAIMPRTWSTRELSSGLQ